MPSQSTNVGPGANGLAARRTPPMEQRQLTPDEIRQEVDRVSGTAHSLSTLRGALPVARTRNLKTAEAMPADAGVAYAPFSKGIGTGAGGASSQCGYGIHFGSDGYTIYAGPLSDASVCVPDNYGFGKNGGIVRRGLLSNSVLELVLPQPDIFFEPPDPKTYFIGSAGRTTTVTIRRKGTTVCPSADCRQINVNTAGQIQ